MSGMDPIGWLVKHHKPAKASKPQSKSGPSMYRYEQAHKIADLIRKEKRAMTRGEIGEALKLGKTSTRNGCNAGAEIGLLKQSRSGLSEHGIFTYWIDLA